MRAIYIIFRRELSSYLRSYGGWVIAALAILLMGVLFQAFAVKTRLAGEMLTNFFRYSSLVVGGAAVILSIRLIAEERQTGSMLLLSTSPVREIEIVIGKFLASLAFLTMILLISVYIPYLIKGEGKISTSQIMVGYTGMFLFGAATLSAGLFASSLVRNQLVAGVIGAVLVVLMCVLFNFSSITDPPVKDVLSELDMWWKHFEPSFMRGILNLKDVIYYLAVTYFFLLLSVKTLEAKRWQ